MHNAAMKLRSAAPQRQFKGGKERNWWDKRSSSSNLHQYKAEATEHVSLMVRYQRICHAFGLSPKNHHKKELLELARVKGFAKLDDWAPEMVRACQKIQGWESEKKFQEPRRRNPGEIVSYPIYDEIKRFDAMHDRMLFIECYGLLRGMEENFLMDPENAKIVLAELPAFLQILPFLETHTEANMLEFWVALKGFSQEMPLEQAAHLAYHVSHRPLFTTHTGRKTKGRSNLVRHLENEDKNMQKIAAFGIACNSAIGGWLVHTGKISLQMAKHLGADITNRWLFTKKLIDNPVFLKLPKEIAADLCRGIKPVELAEGLTRQEAHQWLMHMTTNGEITPDKWLAQRLGVNMHLVLAASDFNGKGNIDIIRWLAKKQGTTAFKVFAKVFVYGKIKEVSFSAYLDEICSADLVNGLETSPAAALRAARIRQAKQVAYSYGRTFDLEKAFPDPELPVVNGITRVEDVDQLINEGVNMGHCVGGVNYQIKCATGDNAIYSVITSAGCSTLQLAKQQGRWYVAQHLGPLNTKPDQANQDLVLNWVEELGKDKVTLRPAYRGGVIANHLLHRMEQYLIPDYDPEAMRIAYERFIPRLGQQRA